ncbi:MAG: Holliday junction branch migration DNA helicase RuvB [Planctomycetota bacterium]
MRLVGGQAYEAMDRQMTKAARGGDVCRRVLAFNLAEMERRRIYYFGGYTSTVQYAVLRLQVSRREARELIVTGRVLLELDEIDAALRSGRISWTKARLLTRIATKETETAWLERALALNCADLEREVATAKKGERPRDNLKGLPEPRVRLDCWLRAVTYEKWELMRAKLSETLRREPSDDDLIGILTELGLSNDHAPPPGSPPGGAVAPSLTASDTSIYRVVIHECPTCHEARLGDGTAVSAEELALAKCDGGIECLSDDEDEDGEEGDSEDEAEDRSECGHDHAPGEPYTAETSPGDRPAEKSGVKQDTKQGKKRGKRQSDAWDDPTPPWLRRKVLARDGHSCRCCGRKTGLHVHHIRWRSRKGRTRLSNLLTLCAHCHALVHYGYLVIEGQDASDVRFVNRRRESLDRGEPLGPPALEIATVGSGATERGALEVRAVSTGGVEIGGSQVGAAEFVRPQDGGSDLGATPENLPASLTAAGGGGAQAPPMPVARGLAGTLANPCGAPATAPVVTLASLPSELEVGWWRRHAHLCSWNERRGVVEFHAGHAADDVGPASVEDQAPVGSCDNGSAPESHRPERLCNIVGQERTIASLEASVLAALKQGRSLDHVLLAGPPGLGKTSIARALAHEMGASAHLAAAPLLRDPGALITLFAGLAANDIVFVDEIHALSQRVEESLYEALEDRRVSLAFTDRACTRTIRLRLPCFTLIGATTELGRLTAPFLSRFTIREELEAYGDAELATIVARAAARERLTLTPAGASVVARCGRGTPREALSLWRRVRNRALARDVGVIDGEFARQALHDLGIDERGLGPTDRKILSVLRSLGNRPMGLARLAAITQLPKRTLQETYEPHLMRLGLLMITPRGRMAV